MSVYNGVQTWFRKSGALRSAALFIVPMLLVSGCGAGARNPATTPSSGNVQQNANLTTPNQTNQQANGTSDKGANLSNANMNNSSTSRNGASHPGSSNPGSSHSGTANVPSNSSTQTGQAGTSSGVQLQLENIQIGDKSVLFTTTHGNMRTVFVGPHIENGNPNLFVVTLVHITPGKYAVNKTTRLQTHWATSMRLVQQGQDLEAQFELLPSIQRFTSAIGSGQMVLYTFQ